MAQKFQVPQFITVEDKVIGPFTIKQFIFLAAGALLIVFLRTIFQGYILYLISIIIGFAAAGLAFFRINEQPLPRVVKNAFVYLLHPRLYIWKQGKAESGHKGPEDKKTPEISVKSIPKLSVSKLSDLAWSLDVKKEKNFQEEKEEELMDKNR